jgi:hypothetical protein
VLRQKFVDVLQNGRPPFILSRSRDDYRRGMYSLLDLLAQLVNTSNYSAIADLPQITTASAKQFSACCVLISRFLATVSKSGDSSASRTQVLLSQPPVQILLNCQLNYSAISSQHPLQTSTELATLILVFKIPRRGPHR